MANKKSLVKGTRSSSTSTSPTPPSSHTTQASSCPKPTSVPPQAIPIRGVHSNSAIYDVPSCLYITSHSHIRNPTTVILDFEDNLREVAKWEVWEDFAPVRPSHIRIVEMPGKGVGMVAARAFKPGETIMVERPTLCARGDLFVDEIGRAIVAPPVHFHNAVSGLGAATHSSFMALKNVHSELVEDNIRGIVRTNGIMLDTDSPPYSHYLAVYPTLSRSNHSCTPTSRYNFDSSTFEGQLVATHDIAVGEEITLGYLYTLETHADRQAELTRKWKFTCTCEACSLPPALLVKSDTRRTLLSRLISDAKYNTELPVRAPLKVFEMGLAWAEEENLPYEYALVAALGAKMANTNYDVKTGKFWTERAFRAWRAIKGEEWSATALEIAEALFRFLGA